MNLDDTQKLKLEVRLSELYSEWCEWYFTGPDSTGSNYDEFIADLAFKTG